MDESSLVTLELQVQQHEANATVLCTLTVTAAGMQFLPSQQQGARLMPFPCCSMAPWPHQQAKSDDASPRASSHYVKVHVGARMQILAMEATSAAAAVWRRRSLLNGVIPWTASTAAVHAHTTRFVHFCTHVQYSTRMFFACTGWL